MNLIICAVVSAALNFSPNPGVMTVQSSHCDVQYRHCIAGCNGPYGASPGCMARCEDLYRSCINR